MIDARMIGAVGHGIGNYVIDLAASLARRSLPFELHYLLSPSCPAESVLRSLPHTISPTPFLQWAEPWKLPREIRSLGAAAFHSPSFMSLASYPCPHIQTVHDLIHLKYGGPFQKLYYRALLVPSLRRAAAVVSVSQSSRAELAAWLAGYGIQKPIELAFNAFTPPITPNDSSLAGFGVKAEEYFFCLSNPKPHKNVELLERAHGRAWAKGVFPLVVNVPGREQAGIIRLPKLSAAEISTLFHGARAYFFPSLYEGFGRSPLEAALCETKPYVSDIPPHRELLRFPEAEFVSPVQELDWEAAFIRSAKLPKAKVSKASMDWILENYSREKLGDSMEKIYRQVLA